MSDPTSRTRDLYASLLVEQIKAGKTAQEAHSIVADTIDDMRSPPGHELRERLSEAFRAFRWGSGHYQLRDILAGIAADLVQPELDQLYKRAEQAEARVIELEGEAP